MHNLPFRHSILTSNRNSFSNSYFYLGILTLSAVLGYLIAMKGDNFGSNLLRLIVAGGIGLWAIYFRLSFLFVLAILTSSTLPVIVYGQVLSLGGTAGEANFRVEYVLFFILIFFFLTKLKKKNIRFPLDLPVFVFIVIQVFSVLVAVLRGYSFGIGPLIRLLEGYAFYFLASRLVVTKEIPFLMKWILVLAAGVSIAIIITTITGSQELFSRLFAADPNSAIDTNFYATFYKGYETPRIGYNAGDNLLLCAFIFSLAMLILRDRGWAYWVMVLLFITRALISGQRFWIVWTIAPIIIIVLILQIVKNREMYVRLKDLLGMVFPLFFGIALFWWVFTTQPAWAEKWNILLIRSERTVEYITGYSQTNGIGLAWNQLLRDPGGFITGFSLFCPDIRTDINLAVLLTVYRYGIFGLAFMIWLYITIFSQCMQLLKFHTLDRTKIALVCTVLGFTLIQIGNGFIRGNAFNENGTQMILFSILLGCMQVIWQDQQSTLAPTGAK